jgi:hypothetical protein
MRIMRSLSPVRRLSVDSGAGTEKPLRTVFQFPEDNEDNVVS